MLREALVRRVPVSVGLELAVENPPISPLWSLKARSWDMKVNGAISPDVEIAKLHSKLLI